MLKTLFDPSPSNVPAADSDADTRSATECELSVGLFVGHPEVDSSMVSDLAVATVIAVLVTASFPFYLYGAWIMIDTEVVTWGVLIYHLKFIAVGLTLNTVPVVVWMIPRVVDQFGGLLAVHAFFGLQAYAMLLVALTGIVRILQVKLTHDLYAEPDREVALDDLHENMGGWRRRLRVGVFGYVFFWLLAWILGMIRYALRYSVFW